jgi:hypothetical protein
MFRIKNLNIIISSEFIMLIRSTKILRDSKLLAQMVAVGIKVIKGESICA